MARLTHSAFQRRDYHVQGQWCLLYGSDDYRKQEALEGLLRRVASAKGGLFEPVTLDAAGLSAARLLECAQTPNLFGPSVTVVRGVQQMHADEQKALADALDRIAPDALVVLVSSSEEGRGPNPALLRAVEKAGTVVDFEEPREQEARRWVQEQAQLLGAAMEARAAAALVEMVGTNLVELRQELDKLVLFCSGQARITAEHVEAVTPRRLDEQVFHMVDAIGTGEVDRALVLLSDLLAAGNERAQPVRLIGAIAHQFRMLWHTKRLLEAGWRPTEEALGEEQAALVTEEAVRMLKSSWRASKYAAQARRFPWPRLAAALEDLAGCDLAIKGGSDAKIALERLVISLCAPPAAK